MDEFDDHVIPYEEAVRRHRALEEAQREKGVVREVKMSDAMNHLLEDDESPDEEAEGPSPQQLRRIVEREFADEGGRTGPHLVKDPDELEEEPAEPMGQLCSFETRKCEDPLSPDEPSRH